MGTLSTTLVFLATTLSAFSFGVSGDFHHLSWARLPLGEAQCQAKSGEVAQALAATAMFKELGAKLFHSQGIIETKGCRVTITFLSNSEPPRPVSSDLNPRAPDEDLDLDYDFWGYKSRQECEADLNHQIDLFRSQTELEPLISYCYEYTYQHKEKTAYQPRVQAFGAAKREMKTLALPKLSEAGHDKVVNDLVQHLESIYGKVARVNMKTGAEFHPDEEVIHYYAATLPNNRLNWFKVYQPIAATALKFQSQEECREFEPHVTQFLTASKATAVTSDCSIEQDGSRLNLAYEYVQYVTTFQNQWKAVPDVKHTTLGQCLAQRPSTIAFFKANINPRFNTAFCSLEYDRGTSKQFYMMYVGY